MLRLPRARRTSSGYLTASRSSSILVFLAHWLSQLSAPSRGSLLPPAFQSRSCAPPSPTFFFAFASCWRAGLCQGAWVIADTHKAIAGFKRDEEYIGTAEERAGKSMQDDNTILEYGPGHIVKLPNFIDHAPASLQALAESDPSVAEYVKSLSVKNGGDGAGYGTDASEDPDEGHFAA